MITRKRRRNQQSPVTKNTPSKRLRRSPNHAATSKSPVNDSLITQSTGSGDLYPVRAILAENSAEFLIDWEDDLITGETYSPTWQRKKNVSKEAIETWHQILNRANPSSLSQSNPGHRVYAAETSAKHRRPSSKLTRPASRPGLRRTAKTVPQLQHDSDDRKEGSLSLIANTQPTSVPELFVQISQHSSLDRDQYLQYISSLSTRSFLSSASPHEDSGLGSDPEDFGLSKSEHEVVVPDSQSLPGSSSYQPTASSIESVSSHSERPAHQYHSYCSPNPSIYSTNPSNSFEARYSDPVEDSSGVYIEESPENKIYSQRSASVPSHDFVQNSRSSPGKGSPFASFTGFGNRRRSSSRSGTAGPTISLRFQEEILDSQEPLSIKSGSQPGQFLPDQLPFDSIRRVSQASCKRLAHCHTNHIKISEDTVTDSQPTQITESEVLSERDPNSQSVRHSLSVRSKEDIPLPSTEHIDSSSLILVDSSDLPATLDSRTPPRAPTLSTMSQTPQAQMSASPSASLGATASGGSGTPSLKQRLAAMRASSRAEAAARRMGNKEPGLSQSTTTTKETTVQVNQQQARMPESRPASLSRPQSGISDPVQTPEQVASPVAATVDVTKVVTLPSKLVESVDALQNDMRKRMANALVKLFTDQTKQAQKQGSFELPPGQSADDFGNRIGLAVEYGVYLNFWGNSLDPNTQYKERFLMINQNVKNNMGLRDRLLNGLLSPNDLSKMSPQDMASKELDQNPGSTMGSRDKAQDKTQDETSTLAMPSSIIPVDSRIGTRPLEVPVEVPLPVRGSHNDAHPPAHSSKLAVHEEMASISQVTGSLYPVDLGRMEFAIPLAMSSRVRDQYLATMNVNADLIHSIEHTSPNHISDDTLKEANELLAQLDRVSIHTDLDDPSTSYQKDATVENLAEWAKINSEKFQFLYHLLLEQALHDQAHFVIIARSGRLLDIVEEFLKGIHVAYHRPDTYVRSDTGTTKGRIEVSLIASGKEGSSVLPRAADLVIALDGSFSAQDPQVETLRKHISNVGQLAPVVHLLIYKSAEHIEKCIPGGMVPIERTRRIISCLTQVGGEVGHIHGDQLPTPHAAEEVAVLTRIWGGHEHYWDSFPGIGPIEGIVSMEYSGEVGASVEMDVDSNPTSERRVIASSGALKRVLDMEGSATPEKRQRMTPVADSTHVSDSVTPNSQPTNASLSAALQEARSENATLKASHAEREAVLQETLQRTQKQLEDYTSALSDLQARYEHYTRNYATLRRERAELETAATNAERKREAQTKDIATAKESRRIVEQELQEARTALLASPVSAIAELERARAEVRQLQAEKALLERKIGYANNETEVTRKAYQEASSAAVDSASQISQLESENKVLQSRASTSAADLAAITQRNENVAIRNQIAGLEATLKDREEVLRRKDEELRELRRGRGMGTRGTSAKPGGSPRGSRGVSPVAGEPMHRGGSNKGLGSALRFGI